MNKLLILILQIVTIVTFFGCRRSYMLETEKFGIELGSDGRITGLTDKSTGKNYSAGGESSHILSIRSEGRFYEASSLELEGETVKLQFREAGVTAIIRTESKDNYLKFELIEIINGENTDLVQWGPIRSNIGETIGETIGVVRDSVFAIGIQALNPRTLGGYPENEDDGFTGYDIFATTSLVDVADSVHIIYRGNTAKPEPYGSSLSAYTRSRKSERIVSTMQHDRYVAPAFLDDGIKGSCIALFGCRPDQVLDIIGEIEIKEGLPHPMLDGTWAKKAGRAVSAYLIQDFTPENYLKAIELTKKAGLKYLYHGDPFRTWGHFELKNRMSLDDLAKIVDEAEAQGIRVGAHTLSNFITTNDRYVTPEPDSRLAKVGSTVITEKITSDDMTIPIADPSFFNQMVNNNLHTVMIGRELIRYEKVSEGEPWMLLNCERGSFGTTSSSYDAGDTISKLADHAYKVFLTDNSLSEEVAERIADLYNTTGLKQISFDGLEGNSSTGMGKYGELLFVKNWYDRLIPEIKDDYIMDASTPGHFFWHMFTRMNWGEPWYAGFRESQTEYRILNQDYFRRNYIPSMLGWFSMRPSTSIEDIEWMLSRSAGFDAGYALVTNASIVEKNGYGELILEKIGAWEKARMSGAFNTGQKKRMENIKNEFTLMKAGENEWDLIQYEVQRFEHAPRDLQPGQPNTSSFSFSNPYDEQEMGFIITSREGSIADITIDINNHTRVSLPVVINPGEALKYQGGREAVIYSDSWNVIKKISVDESGLKLASGGNRIDIGCRFPSENKGVMKIEIRAAGSPERIKSR
jgi:hypothetical protein